MTRNLGLRLDRLEALAPADRGHDQIERSQLRVTAGFGKLLRRLVLEADLNELRLVWIVFTEVGAKTALAFMNLQHCGVPFSGVRTLVEGHQTYRLKPA
jgi:hypothetical protein